MADAYALFAALPEPKALAITPACDHRFSEPDHLDDPPRPHRRLDRDASAARIAGVTCAGCGADLGRPERVGRRDACPHCHAELHACRQCRFYDPQVADACREPQAERVTDKARANFCDYFAPADRVAASAHAPRRPPAMRSSGCSRVAEVA